MKKRIMTFWRPFHMLIYLALFIGVIHANYRGTDFQNIYIQIVYDTLFAGSLVALVLKRWQFFRLKMRVKKNNLHSQNNSKA